MYSFFSTPRVAQRRLQVVACGVALAWAATTAVAAPFGFSPAQATGSDNGFSLRTTLSLASEDLGKPIHVFVVAHVPDGVSGKWYAKGPQGWVAVSGVGVPSFQAQSSADASISLDLAQSEDARGLAGTVLYVGYGVQTDPLVTAEAAFAEMVRSARYRAVYTFVHNSSAAWSLQAATEQSLKAHFQEVLGEAGSKYLATPWALDFMGVSTATTSPSPVASPGAAVPVSGTTLQEAGVDEADRIKTDGQYVFSLGAAEAIKGGAVRAGSDVLVRNKLQASSAQSALPEVDRLSVGFSKDVEATGLYRDTAGQQVAVIGEAAARWGIYDAWFAPQAWTQGVTELALVDTSNPTRMGTTRKLRMNAALIGSRRLGNTLYLVLRSTAQVPGIDPWWPKEKTQSNQSLLDALQVAAVLPTVSVNGGTASALVDAASCFTQPSNAAKTADIISVMAIDLAATVHRHAARCFTGGTEAFYMSEQSLYLATTRSAYTYGNRFPIYAQQSSTDVHKFALNGLDMAYRGSGNVPGHLGFDQNRKSFRLGEHQGTLRVITQSTTSWGGWGIMPAVVPGPTPTPTLSPTPVPENSPGHLSMLQESKGALVVVGELPNARRPAPLGKPNEQLYASRFLGNRGYLVTYRLTDPLYVLDLSNPTDPFIAGELEVSGYSDYLFPLSETLLLGVGKEAIEESNGGDGRFAWYQGVKLSLIDLTNPAKPREAAKSVIGRRGTDATVLRDHHGIALATNGNSVRVSLPVSLHETASTPVSTAANAYFQFTRNELQKFDIDIGQATLRARTALPSGVPGQRDIGRDRSILWGDQVHYYQDGVWTSGLW